MFIRIIVGNPPVDFGDTVCNDGRIFLLKYDSTGKRQWLMEIKGASIYAGDMLVDSVGNVYINGVFSDTIFIEDTTLTLFGDFGVEFFLAKFNTEGKLQWARRSDKADDSTLVGIVDDVLFSGYS